jgi:short-subunit dehydrogenase
MPAFFLLERFMFDYAASTAMVTGASRGIGAELARALASRGIGRLILVARTADDLHSLAERITAHHGTPVEVVVADLAQPGAPESIKIETDRRQLKVDLLINNAGFGSYGAFETLPLGRELAMISVNIAALISLTRLYLPEMVERGRGAVMNVGSTAAFQPTPYMTTYGATKAFVQSFSEGLWAEMQDKGGDVRVICLCPGGTETNFGAVVGADRGRFEDTRMASPVDVAQAGLHALETGQPYIVVGAMNYIGTLMPRIAPRAVVACVAASVLRPIEKAPQNSRAKKRTLSFPVMTTWAVIAAGCIGGAYLLVSQRRERQD